MRLQPKVNQFIMFDANIRHGVEPSISSKVDRIISMDIVKMNPFEFLNAINYTKKDLMVDPENEKHYNSFVINRSLSYFPDTVAIANEMNKYHHLDIVYNFISYKYY